MANMKVKPWQWKKTSAGRTGKSKDESSRIGQFEALESRQLLSSFHPVEAKFNWSGRGRSGTTQVRFDETGNFLGVTGPEASLHPNGLLGSGSKDPNQILVTFSGSINARTLSPSDITIAGDFDPAAPFQVIGVRAKKSTLTISTVGRFATATGAELNFQINNIQASRSGVWMDPWSITADITTDAPCTTSCGQPPRVLQISPEASATLGQAPTVVVARFSEDLQAATVTSASFKLIGSGGVTVTPSSVTYNATTDEARLSFAIPLANGTYEVRLLGTGGAPIRDLQGAALDGNGNGIGGDDFSSTFQVNVVPGNTPPTVAAVTPPANAALTQSPSVIVATFSEPVLAASATSVANFQLTRNSDGATIPATRIDYLSSPPRAQFVVNGALASGSYTVRLSGSIQDLSGAGLDGDGNGIGGDAFTSTFRVDADTTAPTVVGVNPGANVVLTQTPPTFVDVQFSEDIQAATIANANNFSLTRSGGDGGFNNGNEVAMQASSIQYDAANRRARFVISGTASNDVYLVKVRGQGGVQDLAGNWLDGDPNVAGSNDFASVFQVNVPPPPDFDPPTVATITPAEQKVLGTPPSQIVVTFSETLNASTVNGNNFKLFARGTDATFSREIPTTLSYDSASKTVTVVPSEPLTEDIHLFRIETGVTDPAGNRLDGNRDGTGNDPYASTFAISSMVALLGGDPPDPFGDTTSGDGFGRVAVGSVAHDIESVGVMSDQLNAYFRATFFGDIQAASRNLRNSLFGFFDIDIDALNAQHSMTGVPSGAAAGDTSKMDQFGEQIAGTSTHLLGSEFYINLGSEAAHAGTVNVFGTSTGTWLLDNDGGRSISVGETPFVFQPIGTQVFLGDWSGDGRKSLGALHVSTETDRGHLIYVDRDGDGRYDPNEDLDGDGVLDVQEIDIDGDGVVDPNEDLDKLADGTPQPDGKFDAAEDNDLDGRLDNDGPFTFGSLTDFPSPVVLVGDIDGDGQDNIVLFDPATALFLIDVNGNFQEDPGVDVLSTTFAALGDTPFVADFDGDGKAEIAVFRPGVGFVVDADDDYQASAGDVRMSDFVNEDLNGNGLFNNGFSAPLLNEVADGRDYNNDGVLTTNVSEDLAQFGAFNNGIVAPLLDEVVAGVDFNNDGDLVGFAPPGGVIPGDVPVIGDWDGVFETDINRNGSEDLNDDGIFNNGIAGPLLNEVTDNTDYNGDGDRLDTAVSEDRGNLCNVGLGVFNDGKTAPLLADVSEDFNGNCVIDGKTVDIGWFRSSTSELFLNRNAAVRGGFSRLYSSQTREASEDRDPDGPGPLQPNGVLDQGEDRDPDGTGPLLPNGILDLNDGPLFFGKFDSPTTSLIADATAADIPIGQQDFNGDGRDEIGFFRPATGQFFIDQTADGVFQRTTEGPFQIGSTPTAGFPADVPTVGDFDGDGDSDIGVFRRRGDVVVSQAPIFYRNRSFTIKVPLGQIGETPVQTGAAADFLNFGLVVGTGPIFASMTDEVPNICPAGVCNPVDPPAGQFDPPGTTVPRLRPFVSGPLTPVSIVSVRTNLGPIVFSPPTPPTFNTTTGYPTSLIVDMSGPVDPTTVDITTLVLVRTGGDGVFGNGNDIQVFPVSILVSDGPGSGAPNDQITFALPTVPALPGDDYRFTLFGNDPVRDVNGVPIDGEFTELSNISSGRSGNGSAEGDFVIPLRFDRPPSIPVVRLTKPVDRGLQETRDSNATPTIDCSPAVIAISDVPEVSDTGVLDDGGTSDCTPTFIGNVTDERIRITLDPISDTFGTGTSQPDLAGISAEFSTANQVIATTDPNDLPSLAIALKFHSQISLPSATGGGPSVYGFIDLDIDQDPDTGGVAWFEDLNGNRSFTATADLTVDPPVLAEGPLRFGAQSGNADEPVVPALGNWFKSLQTDRTEFGLYNPVTGEWSRDLNGNRTLEPLGEVSIFTGRPGLIPLVGNFFDGPGAADDGIDERGEYDPNQFDFFGNPNPDYGKFYIDVDGNDSFGGLLETFSFVAPAVDPSGDPLEDDQLDVPIVGDWNGDGKDEFGIYRPSGLFFKPDGTLLFPGNGLFFVDINGSCLDNLATTPCFEASEDRNGDKALTPGAPPFGEDANLNNRLDLNDGPYPFSFVGGKPLVGDFTGGGRDRVGVYLPNNSTFTIDLTPTPNFADDGGDGPFTYGIAGDQPVVADWDGNRVDKIGVFRSSARQFILDLDNSHTIGLNETNIFTGSAGTVPIVGNFDGDPLGKQDVGTFLDRNASAQSSLGTAPVSGLGSEFIVDLGSEFLGGHRAEDSNGNGVLDDGEDINGNGALDSGFVNVIDALTGLPVDFNPLTVEIDGAPITLYPDNRGFVIRIPLDFIGETGDGNVNLGAVVGTQTQFTDEVPNNSIARSSQALLVELDSDRNPDVDGPAVFPNGAVVTNGFGQFVVTVTGDKLEDGIYNGLGTNLQQLEFRATDEAANQETRLLSIRVDGKAARVLGFGLFEDGQLIDQNNPELTRLNAPPQFLQVTVDEPLDPNGPVQDLLNYRLVAADGRQDDPSRFLISVQYNEQSVPVRDERLDEDLNSDGVFNNGQVGSPGSGPFLNEVQDGVDYNADGDTSDTFVSEDRNTNGVFDRFTIPGNTIRVHTAPGLTGGIYTFVVEDTVVDLSGNLLDGENFGVAIFPPSGDGVAGGDFEMAFTVNPTPPRLIALTSIGPGGNNRVANCPGADGVMGTPDDESVFTTDVGPDGTRCTADDVVRVPDSDDERTALMRQFFDNDRTNGLDAPYAPMAFEAVFNQPINASTISTGTTLDPCSGTVILYRSGNDGDFTNGATCVVLQRFEPFDLTPDGQTLRVYANLTAGDTLDPDYYRLTFVGGDPTFIEDPEVRFDSTRSGVPIDEDSDGDGIPDPLRVIDTITINAPSTIIVNDINVLLNITHRIPADLDVYLLAPGGDVADCGLATSLTCIELFTDVGTPVFNGAAFRDTVLDDQAGTAIINGLVPFTGSFRPEGQLSVFNGLPLAGVWSLVAADDFINNESGQLDNWSMIVIRGEPLIVPGPNVDVSVEAGTPPPSKSGYQGTPSIDANRDQPLHLVAAYNNGATGVVEVNYSTDDGGMWRPATSIDLNIGGVAFSTSHDASVAFRGGFAGQPEVVYVGLQANNLGVPGSGGAADDNAILVARSNNGGATFGAPTPVTLNRSGSSDVYDDKPDIEVDRGASSNEQGNIYVGWARTVTTTVQTQQVDFLRSTDGGVTFVGDVAAANPATPIRVDRSVDCPDTPALDDCTITRFNATNGTFDIPDNNVILNPFTIEYAPNVLVQDVQVLLNITHTFDADLDVFLVGPDPDGVGPLTSTRVQLFSDVGGAGDNFIGTLLDDSAATAIDNPIVATPPFSGLFRPEEMLAQFDGSPIAGTWTLEVADDTFNFEVGQVLSWSLIFTHQTSGGVANVSVAAPKVQTGGPFYFVDSNAVAGFVDLTIPASTPGVIPNQALAGQDDGAVVTALPFAFDFFGTGYNTLCISSNGLLNFVADPANPVCNRSSNNTDLTTSATPTEPVIAPLWDNLQFGAIGTDRVYFATIGPVGARQFIVQWNDIGGFPSSPSPMTFQVGMFESSGIIEMRYQDVDSGDFRAGGNSATVGIRNANPPALTTAPPQVFQLLFNGTGGPLILDNQSIRFTPAAQRQVFVSWEDWSRGIPADSTIPTPGTPPAPVSLIKVDTSTNAGTTWGIDQVAATTHVNGFFDPQNPTCNADSTKVTREFGSVNPGYCYLIPAQPTRGISASPQIAIDPRLPAVFGPVPRLFLVYTDQGDEDLNDNGILDAGEDLDQDGAGGPQVPNGLIDRLHDNTDIMLTYSDDGGVHWRRPAQVNDDTELVLSASSPATKLATRNSQFLPSIAVDPISGILHIAWYDTRRDPNNRKADLFYTTAVPDRLTGDLTFPNANIRVSTVPADESLTNAQRDVLGLGDYTSITVASSVAHPAWTDNGLLPGNAEVRTSRIEGQINTVTTTNTGHIEDVQGNFFDGEALGVTSADIGLPSGDGEEGGNFVTGFIVSDNEVDAIGRRGLIFVQSNTQPDPLRPPIGSPTNPYSTLQGALNNLATRVASKPANQQYSFTEPNVIVVREGTGQPYVVEPAAGGLNGTIRIPGFTTMVVEPGAIIKMRASNIDVGGSSDTVASAGAALQLRGQQNVRPAIITSLKNDAVGGDTNRDASNSIPQAADWGGIVYRDGSDDNLSLINGSEITYGGGPVPRALGPRFDAIYLESARPGITNNVIANNGVSALPRDAQAAISANFNSFVVDTFDRTTTGQSSAQVGPLIRGNILNDNSLNAIRLRPDDSNGTVLNSAVATLTGSRVAQWDDRDIVHVLTTEALISSGATWQVDPGLIIKMDFAAITIGNPRTTVIIGDPTKPNDDPVVFTSVYDDNFGGDTNNDGFAGVNPVAVRPRPGDWSGIVEVGGGIAAGQIVPDTETTLLMDEAIIKFAGGQTPDGAVRNALIIGTTADTGPGFYQITRNQFIDNLDSAITVQPEVLRADNPKTPQVEDPLFRDNILQNLQFQTQRNGLEISRFADGGHHAMAPGTIALDTSSLWDDTDIIHMLGRTMIALGGAQSFPDPILVQGRSGAETAWLNSLAPMQSVNELSKVDFDDFDVNSQDRDRGILQPQNITGVEWTGVRFIDRNINQNGLRIDHKGTAPTGFFGCDPWISRSSWPDDPAGIPITNTPTRGNVFPGTTPTEALPTGDVYLPFNEDENCNGFRDTNNAGVATEPDADFNGAGDGQLDMGFNVDGDPRRGPVPGLNAITTAGSQDALNLRMLFNPPVYAVGFWLTGSNLTSDTEAVRYFDCNGRPIRSVSASATAAPVEVTPLPTGRRIPPSTTNINDIFLGNEVNDNFFIGLRSLIAICRVDIFENAGLEDSGGGVDFRDAVGVDDLYFSSTQQFVGNNEPPVALTLTSLPTGTQLLTPDGTVYGTVASAESLVVKLGNLGRGFTSSPDVSATAGATEQLIRENVGAGFQFGMDDGIDDNQNRAPQDWGTGSAFRIIGVPGDEATGEPGARVILTSIRDDSVGPKGLAGLVPTADTDGNGVIQLGAAGSAAQGDWGDIFIGSRVADRLDQQDIPRPYDRVLQNPLTLNFPERARNLAGDPNLQVCEVVNPSELVANDPCYGSIIIDADIRYGSRMRFQSPSADRVDLPLAGILPGVEEEFHAITVAQSLVTNYRDFGVWSHLGINRSPDPPFPEDIFPFLLNNVFATIPSRNSAGQAQVTDAVGVYSTAYGGDGVYMHNTFHGNNAGLNGSGLAMNNLFSQNGSAGSGGSFATFNMFFNSGGGFGSSAINFLINAPDGSRPFPDSTIFFDANNLDFRLRLQSRGEDLNGNGVLDPGEDTDPDGAGPLLPNGVLDGFGFTNPAIDSALSELDDGFAAFQIDDRDGLAQLPSPPRLENGIRIYEMGPEKDFYGSLRQDDPRVQHIGAGGRPWFDIGATESRDFGAPVVQNVQLLVGTQLLAVGPGTPGAIVNVSPTEIIVTFSEDLDPRTVTRDSFVLVDSTGTIVPLSSLTFEAGTNRTTNTENTATLVPSVALPDGNYQMTFLGFGSDAITDIDGIRLDGEYPGRQTTCVGTNPARPCTVVATGYDSGNGLPGGNFVATFSVQEAPRITRVIARNATATTALDGDFPPASTFRLSTPPTIIEVTFTEAVNAPLGSFRLTAAGNDRLFDTSDDLLIAGQFTLDSTGRRGTFTPTNPALMPSDSGYRVELDGTPVNPTISAITDLNNILLDGENNEPTTSTSGNGVAGGDWVGYLSVGNPPPPDLRIFVDDNDPIPDNVSDPQPGTANNPFNTIHSGLAAVDDLRKIVFVLPGTYYENVTFDILDYPGTQDPQKFRDVQLISRDGDRMTTIVVTVNEDLDCDKVADANERDLNNNGRIDFACDADGKPVNETLPAVDIPADTNNVTVAGFAITTSGVFVASAPLSGIGVRVDEAPGTKVQRNTIYDNRTGVLINVGSQSPTPRVENNVIWANNGPGVEVRGARSLAADVVNNTIVFNTEGVRLTNTSPNAQARPIVANVYNNIITGSSGAGIRSMTTAGASIDFNDVFRNLGGNFINIQGIGTHNISADPLFLAPLGKPATGRPNPLLTDWRLGSFSSAIDAALGRETDTNSNSIPDLNEDFNRNGAFDIPSTTDHDNRGRRDDTNVVDKGLGTPTFIDLGAFERQSNSSGAPGSAGATAARTAVRAVDQVLESGGDGVPLPDVVGKHRKDDETWADLLDAFLGRGRMKRLLRK